MAFEPESQISGTGFLLSHFIDWESEAQSGSEAPGEEMLQGKQGCRNESYEKR